MNSGEADRAGQGFVDCHHLALVVEQNVHDRGDSTAGRIGCLTNQTLQARTKCTKSHHETLDDTSHTHPHTHLVPQQCPGSPSRQQHRRQTRLHPSGGRGPHSSAAACWQGPCWRHTAADVCCRIYVVWVGSSCCCTKHQLVVLQGPQSSKGQPKLQHLAAVGSFQQSLPKLSALLVSHRPHRVPWAMAWTEAASDTSTPPSTCTSTRRQSGEHCCQGRASACHTRPQPHDCTCSLSAACSCCASACSLGVLRPAMVMRKSGGKERSASATTCWPAQCVCTGDTRGTCQRLSRVFRGVCWVWRLHL